MMEKKFLSIKIVGVGGAGCNALNNILDQLGNKILEEVVFISMNTDAQALEQSKAQIKLQLGDNGLGAGSNPAVGKECAEQSAEDIKSVLDGANLVIINAGFGGGTGSGAAAVVARLAKESGALVMGIVTKPFKFEGEARRRIAEEAVREFKQHADVTVVIANQLLFRSMPDRSPLKAAFKQVDNVCTETVECIVNIIRNSGLINIDFADIRATILDKGTGIVGTCFASGENAAEIAARGALSNPLLEDTSVSMSRASHILVQISGNSLLTLDDVETILTTVQNVAGDKCSVIYGTYINDSEHSECEKWISVFIIATGLSYDSSAREENVRHHRQEEEVQVVQEINPFAVKSPFATENNQEEEFVEQPKRGIFAALADRWKRH